MGDMGDMGDGSRTIGSGMGEARKVLSEQLGRERLPRGDAWVFTVPAECGRTGQPRNLKGLRKGPVLASGSVDSQGRQQSHHNHGDGQSKRGRGERARM